MTEIAVIIVGQANQMLWGLSPETRLARLTTRAGAGRIKAVSQLGPEEPVLLIRADAVVEERLIRALLAQPGLILTAISHDKEKPWHLPQELTAGKQRKQSLRQ